MAKKKEKKDKSQLQFELNFTDITMVEADGRYEKVVEIMADDDIGDYDWVVKSFLIINSQFGMCRFKLDFYRDGRVYIIDYLPSAAGIPATDVGCLTRWCQEYGWKIPEPTEKIIRDHLEVWKSMWNTLLVDSVYLDARFGIRAALDIRNVKRDDDDGIEQDIVS